MFESDDDRLSMLEDFGVTAEVNGRTFVVILDNQHDNDFGISTTVPVAIARTSDVKDISRNTKIYVDNTQYTVAEIQPDGQGMTYMPLQEV